MSAIRTGLIVGGGLLTAAALARRAPRAPGQAEALAPGAELPTGVPVPGQQLRDGVGGKEPPKWVPSTALLHPELAGDVMAIFEALERRGFDPVFFEGARSAERAEWLKANGFSKLGAKSYHVLTPARPLATAVDIISKEHAWGDPVFFEALAEEAESRGLKSGLRWKWVDAAHIELP